MAQQPFHIWILTFFGIATFIYLLENYRTTKDRHSRLAFCVAWCLYALIVCDWISFFGIAALIAFGFAQFLFAYLFSTLISKALLDNQFGVDTNPLLKGLFYGFSWVAFEFLLSHLPVLSFSWLNVSTTLVDTPLVSFARIGGGALLSFLIVFIPSVILFVAKSSEVAPRYSLKKFAVNFLAIGFIIAMIFTLSKIQINSSPITKTISVVQGNDKNRYLSEDEISSNYLENSHLRLAAKINNHPDIIIFPESAFNSDINDSPELLDKLGKIAVKANDLLIANSIATEGGSDFNRNYFYSPNMKLLGTYDKKRLVPFGEYVPMSNLIGQWSLFDQIGTGFKAGSRDQTIRGVTTLICFESAFTDDVKNAISDKTNLLVVTTNNRSYRRSGNAAQHKALTQLRAAEYGVSVVQASVSGSSALIGRDGRAISSTKLFERTVLSGELSWGPPDSIYSKTGDWLSLMSVLVVGLVCLNQLRKYRWKSHTLTE